MPFSLARFSGPGDLGDRPAVGMILKTRGNPQQRVDGVVEPLRGGARKNGNLSLQSSNLSLPKMPSVPHGAVDLARQVALLYRWCNPPSIGHAWIAPAAVVLRLIGASLFKARCVRAVL